ncbi:hypothetical protein [Roseicyclus sp.]|uniref:hypothetical protein n=1 Tax=Roseicyclus sp. TaxID=1914329 RepID=UPI003F6B6372
MLIRRPFVLALAVALGAGLALLWQGGALAQMAGHGHGMHQHGAGGMMGHDMANMPGLRGLDATDQETAELAVMFQNFTTISRTVENLPDGIRTVTGSSDPAVMDALIAHVAGMIARVEQGRDPQIFIQSPTLDIFFARGDRLDTVIDYTDAEIIVTQTSTDPTLVAALHAHAAEVSAMADRGMAAVHEMMMATRP